MTVNVSTAGSSVSSVDTSQLGLMWLNFLNSCKLGTVLEAADTTVWQKRARYEWARVGAAGDYSADSIAWPVHVLQEGIS
jgi:hypothetical protein